MANSKKIQAWLPLVLSVVMLLGMFTGYRLYRALGWQNAEQSAANSAFFEAYKSNSLQQVMDLIDLKYVDSLGKDSLEIAGLEAIINKLDPHSQYIPSAKMADVASDLSGNFTGIGVEYQIINDTVMVVAVIDKGPAALAGLLEGDAIITINDSTVAGVSINNAALRTMLRGQANSKVEVSLSRNGVKLNKSIRRGAIPQPSLDASYMVDGEIGYIKLNRFAETTFFEFMDAATALTKSGMKKMVLDLRGNGGGLLEEATKIADELLEDGTTIVSIRGKGVKNQTTISSKEGIFEEGPLVILIDEQSASASEVLAAALQENDRATIIGRRSFGKGLVQEQYPLANNGALRLTVARYYTPLGRSIQKPYTNGRSAYAHEVMDRLQNGGAMQQTDTVGKKIFTTPKGKKLYEAGGVTPDYWIPFDSLLLPQPIARLYNSNQLLEYAYYIFHNDKANIVAYKNPIDFYNQYKLSNQAATRLSGMLQSDSAQLYKPKEKDQLLLENRVKALIARYQWRSNAFYQILNLKDPTVLFAVQQLKKTS